jgi:hypothetical protein
MAGHFAVPGTTRKALTITWTQVQNALAPSETLVEFLRYPHYLGNNRWELRYASLVILVLDATFILCNKGRQGVSMTRLLTLAIAMLYFDGELYADTFNNSFKPGQSNSWTGFQQIDGNYLIWAQARCAGPGYIELEFQNRNTFAGVLHFNVTDDNSRRAPSEFRVTIGKNGAVANKILTSEVCGAWYHWTTIYVSIDAFVMLPHHPPHPHPKPKA